MDYQQPPPPPPPPSTSDHHHHPHIPPPPNHPYYSPQFQYQNPQHHHSSPLPPPPPHHQQWAPPPYPPHHHHYPSHLPPPPPPYQQPNQGWSNANWVPQHAWKLQVEAHTSEDDWAAKARAWAAANSASDQQQRKPQLTPVARLEEQTQYHDPHAQPIESQFQDMQHSTLTAPSYLQHAALSTSQHRPPVSHPQEFASLSSGQSSFKHLSGDSAGAFHQPQQSSISHQQEVPSSYSSIAGNGDAGQSGTHYMLSSSFPPASAPHHLQPPLPAAGRSMPLEEVQYAFGNHTTEPPTNLSDQPLDFTRYNHDYEVHAQATYSDSGIPVKGVDNVIPVPSNYSWGPAGSGVMYPSAPPMIQLASQVDPPMAIPSPILGYNSTTLGRLSVPNFQQSGPPIGPPYTVGVGAALHSPAAFPGDGFRVSDFSERPIKPSVPNWLREEIIKKKAVMTSSTVGHPGVDNQLMEDYSMDRTNGKSEPADSKSIDSSKSTEEEDEDEDDVEAARTAAINQEIKRVLTEVLLKVTDELFDEIATKVLIEDDLTVEEYQSTAATNREGPLPAQAALIGTEAKVLIPVKYKEAESDNANEKYTLTSPGDILGLANYASDDEDDDKEVQSFKKPSSRGSTNNMESESNRNLSGKNLLENEVSLERIEEVKDKSTALKIDAGMKKQDTTAGDINFARESKKGDELLQVKIKSALKEDDMLEGTVSPVPKEAVARTARPRDSNTSSMEHLDGGIIRSESDKSDKHEMRRSSFRKEYAEDEDIDKDRVNVKGVENHKKYDEKHLDREKNSDQSDRKDKAKEKGAKTGDKDVYSDSRRRPSPSDVKERKREKERENKSRIEEENGGKKERIKEEKGEKTRPKSSRDSRRHKMHHSPSKSRGKDSKDGSIFSEAADSDDESAIDSRRKRRSRRNESPSPVRSKRRHVSRSPHSRHSQQRHSHYTSSDSKRWRRSRSRSRSPVRSRKR